MPVIVTVNDISFELALEDTETAQAFLQLLPIELDMTDVNGNEKFCLLADSLPGQPEKFCSVQAGQLMLYQHKSLILFYQDACPYFQYCEIGQIIDKEGFAEAVQGEQISVCFE